MASVTNHFDWDNPDYSLLSNRRGKLPAFPVEHFSPGFTKWLARASRGAGCSADHLAVLSIGVCSSLIGKARQIQASTSWIEPTTSWCAVIGESGERKTAGQRAIMRTKKIELENRPVYQDANAKHQQRVEKARLATAKWKRDVAQAITEKKNDLPKMPDEAIDPGSFIWPWLAVSDCTHQRLARLCNVRPRGMLMVRSELSGFFANMRAAGARGFFLESWDGGRYVVERVADEKCITVENLLVGIVGGLQPSKISRAFAGDEDGMYARFLFGWPESPEFQELSNDIEVVDPFFQSLLTKLIRLPEDKEKILALSPAAQQEFENYRRFVDHTKRGHSGRELHWLSKSETHVLRLCNTLAYLDWAEKAPSAGLESFSALLEPDQIEAKFMISAIALVKNYFWPHARAALRQIGLNHRDQNIRHVLRWIKNNEFIKKQQEKVISLRQIRREALSEGIDGEEAHDLIERMVAAGWLKAKPIEKVVGRPRARWIINLLLFKDSAEEAADGETTVAEIAETAKTSDGVTDAELSAVTAILATSKSKKRKT